MLNIIGNQIEIRIRIYICVLVSFLFLSCSNNIKETNIKPLVTVINLQSAESIGDFVNARNYIDVDEVYSKYTKSPEQEWRQMVVFFNTISKDNKFTNCFKYYKYDITEKITKNKASIIFESKNQQSQIKKITYSLEIRNQKWVVVGINFEKFIEKINNNGKEIRQHIN